MIDLVLNRRARHLAGDGPVRRALLDAARETGACIHETHGIDELDAAARTMAARGTSRVILAGGDGSYMAGVTALARAFSERPLPTITFAPGGTVSTVARNWCRSGNNGNKRNKGRGWGAREAAAIVRAAREPSPSVESHPTLRVTDDRGGERVGFIFGAGLVASFFEEYNASPAPGYAAAAGIVARVFAQSFVGGALAHRVLDPVEATLTLDGEAQRPPAWSLVLASVVRDVGLHMWVTPRAGEALDAFHAVASPLGPRALGPQMPLVLAGKRLRGRGHVDEPRARDLSLRFRDDARGAYVLDGDLIHAREVRVRVGPVLRLAT